MIDRWGTEEYAGGEGLFANAGVVETRTRTMAVASAGIGTWSAGTANGIASVSANVGTASAVASYGYDGVSAFANASLASVGAQVGPVSGKVGLDATTGGSIGWGGVEASFLGFGFSVGLKTGISLPFASFSIGL